MDNVVCEVVLTPRNKNLGAVQCIPTIGLRRRLGAGQSQITAGMRFSEAHGGEPFAGAYFAEVSFFDGRACVVFDAFISTMKQTRRHGPTMIGA